MKTAVSDTQTKEAVSTSPKKEAPNTHYSPDPESFIPIRRRDLVELCLKDERLKDSDREAFRHFGKILTAWFHQDLHETEETLKATYAPKNPDTDMWLDAGIRTGPSDAEASEEMVKLFRVLAERGNYREIPFAAIEEALDLSSLIDVRTTVDFDDYEHIVGFYRGDVYETLTRKRFFRKVETEIDILQRVALLLQFKDEAYFEEKKQRKKGKKKKEELPFKPGKIYLYLYKNVPKHDIELLFPNVQVGMTLKDRLLFGVPAVGASIGVVAKALPKLLILVGVILFFTMGPQAAEKMGVNRETASNFMPVLAAILAVVVTLGGFAFKQFDKFKNKKIQFQKNVADTLFFRNLATNDSVIHRLIDQAEEAESKEILLVYYHLLVSPTKGLTKEELDQTIEQWMSDKFGRIIDFDIDGPIAILQNLRGTGAHGEKDLPLLHIDDSGHLHVASLEDSCRILDELWDNVFDYSNRIAG